MRCKELEVRSATTRGRHDLTDDLAVADLGQKVVENDPLVAPTDYALRLEKVPKFGAIWS
jgi:hypothetical protein